MIVAYYAGMGFLLFGLVFVAGMLSNAISFEIAKHLGESDDD